MDEITIVDDKMLERLPKLLSKEQRELIRAPIPAELIKQRKGYGGTYSYVPHHVFASILNALCDHDWDLEVTGHEWFPNKEDVKQVMVWVKLTIRVHAGSEVIEISKPGYASAQVPRYSDRHPQAGEVIDIGNAFKTAQSLAFSKACSLLGLGGNVYAADDYLNPDVIDEYFEEKEEPALYCESCGVAIEGVEIKGIYRDAAWVASYTLKQYGKVLCVDDAAVRRKEIEAAQVVDAKPAAKPNGKSPGATETNEEVLERYLRLLHAEIPPLVSGQSISKRIASLEDALYERVLNLCAGDDEIFVDPAADIEQWFQTGMEALRERETA